MQRVTDLWLFRLGRLPALPIVAVGFAIAVLATIVLPKHAATGVGLVLVALLALDCLARPREGWGVWRIWTENPAHPRPGREV